MANLLVDRNPDWKGSNNACVENEACKDVTRVMSMSILSPFSTFHLFTLAWVFKLKPITTMHVQVVRLDSYAAIVLHIGYHDFVALRYSRTSQL